MEIHLSNNFSRCSCPLYVDPRMSCFKVHFRNSFAPLCGRIWNQFCLSFDANLWSIIWQVTFKPQVAEKNLHVIFGATLNEGVSRTLLVECRCSSIQALFAAHFTSTTAYKQNLHESRRPLGNLCCSLAKELLFRFWKYSWTLNVKPFNRSVDKSLEERDYFKEFFQVTWNCARKCLEQKII